MSPYTAGGTGDLILPNLIHSATPSSFPVELSTTKIKYLIQYFCLYDHNFTSLLPVEFPANEDDIGDFASGEQQADEALGRV